MTRNSRNLVLALVLGAMLPLRGTAVAPVPPASEASCCSLATSYASSVFPGGNGDEGFFALPVGCPSGTCEDTPPWLDERTASGATVLAGCVDWNTFRPRSTSSSSDPCASADTSAARNLTYLADFISGAPSTSCGYAHRAASGTLAYVRARPRSTLAPPPDPTQLVAVGVARPRVRVETSSAARRRSLAPRADGAWSPVSG